MRNIYITYGPPLSGKSTFANLITKYDPSIKVISRDIIRDNLKDHSNLPEIEKMITKIEESYVSSLIKSYDVICDNTFSKLQYVKDLIKIIQKNKVNDVKLKLIDFSDVPLETLYERSIHRERKVPIEIIKKIHNKCKQNLKNTIKLIDDFNSNELKISSENQIIINKIPTGNNHNGIIVDIDGTLAHHHGNRDPFEYHKVINDDVDEIVKHIVIVYRSLGYQIIIVSGRDDSCFEMTSNWLNKHQIPYDYLYMRKTKDFRKDSIVKKEIYEKYIKDSFNVLFCLDDRNQVVEMWREIGIKCLQVQEGNF
jgi:predicted kinase